MKAARQSQHYPFCAWSGQILIELFTVENAIALLTLSVMEIVLGIDNVVFIAILSGALPPAKQKMARNVGLAFAMVSRIALLFALSWMMRLTTPLFDIPAFWTVNGADAHSVSGRDLILLLGGLFLIAKATYEVHDKLEGGEHEKSAKAVKSMTSVIVQIMVLDLVFSLDSVITAIGMVQTRADAQWIGLTIMVTAIVIAVAVMLLFAGRVSAFVERHPTMKMLALAFLILIGVMLVAEGLHAHMPKGYVYFAMAFSFFVELLNMRLRKVSDPVKLHRPMPPSDVSK